MTCSNCALGVTRMLQQQGLQDVQVDFTTGDVVFDEIASERLPDVEAKIRSLGYSVRSGEEYGTISQNDRQRFPATRQEWMLLFCSALTIPLMGHMLIDYHLLHNPWFQLTLCLPVFIMGMLHFGKSAWSSIKTGIPNMDVLVTIGSLSAFLYSIIGVAMHYGTEQMHQYLFFETTATIITLILLGNVIEARSVRKTTSALRQLMALQPSWAERIRIGKDLSEQTETIAASELKPNDLVLLRTGDAIPADGKIYWGDVYVDASAMTGESVPALKSDGDTLLTGTVVQQGTAKMVVTKTGSTTVLAGIIDLVKRAQQSKPNIQKLGDKVSAWFVPAVVLISIAAFFLNLYGFDRSLQQSLMNAISVLVISCPCAMGLATPTAVAVGLGAAARNGILVKGGDTLERFNNIKTVVFDKTGTLTTGTFSIQQIHAEEKNRALAINAIYSLESHSNHPIAKSLVHALRTMNAVTIRFQTIDETKGVGIKGTDEEGRHFELVSEAQATSRGAKLGHDAYLFCNGSLMASLEITDTTKHDAAETIALLKKRGIKTVMLSGDSEKNCQQTAKTLGIDHYRSNMLPHQKTEYIRTLMEEGPLVMVGDGINDAPSLETAHVGISFGEASSVAVNAADVVIVKQGDLRSVITAIDKGRMTFTAIKQNLFWAFAYNVVAIPIAAVGLLSPMVAALSMAFSDVVVIGNSLRLRLKG